MLFKGRAVFGAVVLAGGVLLGTAAPAVADDPPPPPPACTAADLAFVMGGVTAETATYLFTHPDVNAFFTGLKGQPRDQMREQVTAYLDANPQVRAELQVVRQPSIDFRHRCDAPADVPLE